MQHDAQTYNDNRPRELRKTNQTTVVDTARLAEAVKMRRGKRTLREIHATELPQIDYSTLHRVESRKFPPSLDTYVHLCRWIGADFDYFLLPARDKVAA